LRSAVSSNFRRPTISPEPPGGRWNILRFPHDCSDELPISPSILPKQEKSTSWPLNKLRTGGWPICALYSARSQQPISDRWFQQSHSFCRFVYTRPVWKWLNSP